MAAAATDKLQQVGLSTATTLSAPGYTTGGTGITVGSTTNWPTATGVTFAIDTVTIVNGVEVQDAGSYNEYVGTVATGTTITNMSWADGNGDRSYSAGSTTRVYIPVSKTRENRIVSWGLTEHNQNGTHAAVTATSVASTGSVSGTTGVFSGNVSDNSTTLTQYRVDSTFDYVVSGGVWSGDAYASTRNASMTAIVVWINGQRGSISAVTARSFTASKDTYIDVLNTAGVFTLVYTEVANNAASPALAANSLRVGIIVTGATNIAAATSVNQGQETMLLPIASSVPYAVTDSLGNLICPRDPNRKVLGYRQITASTGQTSASSTYVDITGLSVPVIVPTGRKIKITYFVSFDNNNITALVGAAIREGSTALQATRYPTAASAGWFCPVLIEEHTTPSAGSHTYLASFQRVAGTGTLSIAIDGNNYIRVELV